MVRVVVASARGGGAAVKRPWLGAELQEVTPEIADSLGLKRPGGALVANVATGGPAARAGIKTGDLIVSIDGTVVDDPELFRLSLCHQAARRQCASRRCCAQGREVAVTVGLQTAPEIAARGSRDPRALAVPRRQGGQPFAGACRRAAARRAGRRRRDREHCRRLDRAIDRLPQGRHRRFGQQSEDRAIGGPRSRHPRRRAAVAGDHQPRRPADLGHVQWMILFAT